MGCWVSSALTGLGVPQPQHKCGSSKTLHGGGCTATTVAWRQDGAALSWLLRRPSKTQAVVGWDAVTRCMAARYSDVEPRVRVWPLSQDR